MNNKKISTKKIINLFPGERKCRAIAIVCHLKIIQPKTLKIKDSRLILIKAQIHLLNQFMKELVKVDSSRNMN